MNKSELLKRLIAHAALLHPETCAQVTGFLQAGLDGLGNADTVAASLDLRKRAYAGDVQAFQELNALRIDTIDNFVIAQTNPFAFFQGITLKDDEQPFLQNKTKQEVKARFIGEDGKAQMTQIQKNQSQLAIALRLISSDTVEFPLRDIYKGDVADDAQAQVDVAHDVSAKMAVELWNLIKASVGPFVTTGAKQLRTYNLHSSIKPANIPDTNLIVPASNTNSTKFRFAVIRAIVQYCMQWGTNSLSTGELKPMSIFIPSKHVGDMLDEIDTDSPDNAIVEEIRDVGWALRVGGKQMTLVADATLDPDEFRCYVSTNKPIGNHYTKPGMDQFFPGSPSEITSEQRRANKGEMSTAKVYGAVIPEFGRIGVIGVQYRTV